MKQKNKILTNELIFLLYFWRLVILKPITTNYLQYGIWIVLIYSAILIILSFIINRKIGFRIKIESIGIIILICYIVFLFDYLFRPTNFVLEYMYQLLLSGVIPVYLLLKINNIPRFLNIFCKSGIILFTMYSLDPIRGFQYFNNYMVFGFQLMLPAFLGMDIGRTYFKKRWIWIPEIICLIEIIIFSNRSCFLSVLFYFILKRYYMCDVKKDKIKIFKQILILFVLFIIVLNWDEIILYIYNIVNKLGYNSYSLSQYVYYIQNGEFITGSSTGGRSGILKQAQEMFLYSPFFGSGSGVFIEKYGYYTHNIITDLLVQYGVIGLIYFTYYIVKAIKKAFMVEHIIEYRALVIITFCLWCPKLFFSTYLFNDIGLWIFLAICLSKRFIKRNEISKIEPKI